MLETILWLALNVYWEARNQPLIGQEAVTHVVLNRMSESGRTAKQVITSKDQFSWYWDGKSDFPSDEAAFNKAIEVVSNVLITRGSTSMWRINHYHTVGIDPYWSKNMRKVITIGDHVFYRR